MFIALSIFLPYLFGLGCLITSAAPSHFNTVSELKQGALRKIVVILLAGLLSNYLLVLTLGHLGLSLVIGLVLALLGLFIVMLTPRRLVLRLSYHDWIAMCVVVYLVFLYGMHILFEPLFAWDARSIWFFHGKMIFYDQAFSQSAGWTEPAVQFSHIEYPKLIAVLAAQFTYVAGFWNEYFPKAALLALLIPALIAMQSFISVRRISFYYFLSFMLFSLGWWLWNGCMDGYLALYATLSVLFLGRWLEKSDMCDLYAGIGCMGIVINLKNEGLMFVLMVTIIAIALRYTRRHGPAPVNTVFKDRGVWSLIVLSSLGLIIWYLLKWQWGVGSESLIKLHRIPMRMMDGSLILILKTLLLKNGVAEAVLIFLVTFVVAKTKRFHLRMPLSAWLAILTSLVYFSGMITVYLATVHDLAWHLSTSSERTMLPVLLGIFCTSFLLVQRIEVSGGTQGKPSL